MLDLKKYFQPVQLEELHPKAREWRQWLKGGDAEYATCELWRKRDGITFMPAKLYVKFYVGDKLIGSDQDNWDPDLNMELVNLKVQAISLENEAIRLSLMMQEWFSISEERFGDGYFNAVLIEYLRHSGFSNGPPVQEALEYIHEPPPNFQTPAYKECNQEIEGVLTRAARLLRDDLEYDQSRAEEILAAGVAHYLDERFSITNRKLLGLV